MLFDYVLAKLSAAIVFCCVLLLNKSLCGIVQLCIYTRYTQRVPRAVQTVENNCDRPVGANCVRATPVRVPQCACVV